MNDLIRFLEENGCSDTGHSGESLLSHLLNTYSILNAVGADEEVALAGGLHSIYGTNAFKKQTVGDRKAVEAVFGSRTERLAYLFGHINRPKALEAISDAGGEVKDRLTGEPIQLDGQDVADLRLIEAANLLEQGSDVSAYPKICATIAHLLNGQDDHG